MYSTRYQASNNNDNEDVDDDDVHAPHAAMIAWCRLNELAAVANFLFVDNLLSWSLILIQPGRTWRGQIETAKIENLRDSFNGEVIYRVSAGFSIADIFILMVLSVTKIIFTIALWWNVSVQLQYWLHVLYTDEYLCGQSIIAPTYPRAIYLQSNDVWTADDTEITLMNVIPR